MFCKHCGAKLDEGAKFCRACGTPVEGKAGAGAAVDKPKVPVNNTQVQKPVQKSASQQQAQRPVQPAPQQSHTNQQVWQQQPQVHQSVPQKPQQKNSGKKNNNRTAIIIIVIVVILAALAFLAFHYKDNIKRIVNEKLGEGSSETTESSVSDISPADIEQASDTATESATAESSSVAAAQPITWQDSAMQQAVAKALGKDADQITTADTAGV